jgi:hypothetical protein
MGDVPIRARELPACTWCDEPVPADVWLEVEVCRPVPVTDPSRPDGDGRRGVDYADARFCSADHASRWLAEGLPEAKPVEHAARTWGERIGEIVLLAGGVAVVGLVGIGIATVVSWLR